MFDQTHYFLFHVVCHSDRLETRLGGGFAGFLVVFLLKVKLVITAEIPLSPFPAGSLPFHPTIP